MTRREHLKSLLAPFVAPAAVGAAALLPEEPEDVRYHPDRKKIFGEHGLVAEHLAELRRNRVEYTGYEEGRDGRKWATWKLRK